MSGYQVQADAMLDILAKDRLGDLLKQKDRELRAVVAKKDDRIADLVERCDEYEVQIEELRAEREAFASLAAGAERARLALAEGQATAPGARPMRDQQQTIAAMFEGLERLIATSSRDWGTYRVDAWLWAVLVGWDCKKVHEHDDLCDNDAAMADMAERHGWDEETVAKARRYRAAVAAAVGNAQ